MVKDVVKKSMRDDMFDSFKKKLIEFGIDYVKKNFNFKKEDVAKYVERHIQRTLEVRVRREVRKQVFRFSSYALLGLGGLFVVYFVLDLVASLLLIPDYFTNLLFGLFLVLMGFVLFLLK